MEQRAYARGGRQKTITEVGSVADTRQGRILWQVTLIGSLLSHVADVKKPLRKGERYGHEAEEDPMAAYIDSKLTF